MQPKTETLAHRPATTLAGDPQWYKDAIIYEVHVKAFYDSVDDGIGDFAGLMEKLDYIQDLGATAVWLLPFYPSPLRDDGYDIADYYNVHPDYGTLKDFRQFVRQAHHRGIRVITELVVNHTSDQHPWFQRARRAPAGSSERDFYVWSDSDQKYDKARVIFTDAERSNWTWDHLAKAYYWHRFFSHQPDLNFDNPRVLREVVKVLRFWLDMGVDGLRLDAVPYLIEREGTNCENLAETHVVLKRLRSEVDARYQDRMLLAEANQWPSDVLPYFGDGDECHMAFHFPLMPRIFMAVRQEDRHPIVEILRQTPPIPESCQWALFLRNHDELTLEMVTDEERDYMYKEYAHDVKMRVNIGIRRRLATLMEHNRRRIELLYSLLFSLPGTPVIYYGDEIGMGDNIYLGDRNGVRTPMQWTGDRNGGFSRSDPARLYSPVVMDPICGFQAVNVEAQQRNPSSLLNFMKRMIALRKRYKTFGRGTIELLHPQNRKVLAYIRRHDDEIILCVANLSRFVQPAELDLSALVGMIPVEMIGHTEFPRIGELPYFVTLGPHAFYWFLLLREPASLSARPPPEPQPQVVSVPRVRLATRWEKLLQTRQRRVLEQSVIPPYLLRQPWFAGKARRIRSARIVDWTVFRPAAPLTFLTLVNVRFAEGPAELYLLPLAVSTDRQIQDGGDAAQLAVLSGPEGEAVLYDAVASDAVAEQLLDGIGSGLAWTTQSATIEAIPTSALGELRGDCQQPLKIARWPEGANSSSVLYGNRLILKLYRRLEQGLNPDIELSLHLRERTSFCHVPRVGGTMQYDPPKGELVTLAIVQELVNNEGSGWEHALQEVGQYLEAAEGLGELGPQYLTHARSMHKYVAVEPPLEICQQVSAYLRTAETLGRRTAQMHQALTAATDDPAFDPEATSKNDLLRFSRDMTRQVRTALKELKRHVRRLSAADQRSARDILRARETLVNRVAMLSGVPLDACKIRCHGDYHLGRVLRCEGDFVVLDSRGEPGRSIEQRRRKGCPLRDVAAMMRSFSAAGYAGLWSIVQDRPQDLPRLEPWVAAWYQWISAEFLRSYLQTAGDAVFLPKDHRVLGDWLEGFLLERACLELVNALRDRPALLRAALVGMMPESVPIDDDRQSAPDPLGSGRNGRP